MSLVLNDGTEGNVSIKSLGSMMPGISIIVNGESAQISDADFAMMVKYYMTNTDLHYGDKKSYLASWFKTLELNAGHNHGHQRYMSNGG